MNNVNLAEYLPPFLREYRELKAVMNAENPEFEELQTTAETTLKNSFIATADEVGIARFEKFLNIYPSDFDTLESRKARVLSRWFSELPYTLEMFVQRLTAMAGEDGFSVTKDYEHYRVEILTHFDLYGQINEVIRLAELMFPCNIIADIRNSIECTATLHRYVSGGATLTEIISITD